jgi:hypothetical protein
MKKAMTVDLVMGALGALIGMALVLQSAQLASYMKEADDRYREHPWVQVFEPSTGRLATDDGRVAAFRAYFVVAGGGFLAISAALAGRALLGL